MTDLAQRVTELQPEQLERLLERLAWRGQPEPEEQPIRRQPRDGAGTELSFGQERIWFLDQIEPGTPVYNMTAALDLRGELGVTVLAAALREVVLRHESLRTTFVASGGKARQVVAPAPAVSLSCLDLAALPAAARQAELRRLHRLSTHFRFCLARGPLLSTWLVREGERQHTLLITMHHIVADGWSVAVFVREVSSLYAAFAAGRPSPLAELDIQYPDFAAWQRLWLRGETLARLVAAWREQLAGAPPLELPTDRPRPALQSHRGANLHFTVSPDLVQALRHLAARERSTLFMVLLAAFDAMLGRYSGQDDFCVGTYVANRNRSQIEELIGFFVNNLALRARLRPEDSWLELLARIRETATVAFAHQDLPFEALLDALQPARSLRHTPVFQVMLVLHNLPPSRFELPGLAIHRTNLGADWANFDLMLAIEEVEGRLAARLEYAADLFAAATAARLAGHFVALLGSLAAGAQRLVAEAPLLTPPERQQLLVEGPGRGAAWPTDGLIHQLFGVVAAARSGAVAAVAGARHLTYGELDARAADLARRLAASGVAPDSVVGLCVDPGTDLLVCLLAVWRAGGALLPLDPANPRERLSLMLEDARVRLVVTERRLAALVPATVPRLLVDAAPRGPDGRGHPPAAPGALPEHLAYVIYTSGSTGRPKGVAVSHRNLVPMMLWGLAYFRLGAHTRVLQNLSYCFDFGVFEILTTLLAGGTLVFVDAPRGDFVRRAEAVAAWGLNTVHTTPSFCRELAAAGARLDSLEIVHLGGEALARAEVRRIAAALGPDCRVFNGYGPTEVTINSCIHEIERGVHGEAGAAVPIGRATANNEVYLLDRQGQPVPLSVPAELCVGGDGVARGYLGHPSLTAERFIPDAFGSRPGMRLYRTGDLVRRLPDGQLEFLGRIDQQVKIRGHRVELGEIEAVLRGHPGVTAAVAALRPAAAGGQRLVAYLTAGRGEPATAELRALAERSLPPYMVPAAFVFLSSLPLTATGKLDRLALPQPEPWQPALARAHVAPRTPVEEVLAGIWSEVLGVERIGVHDGFFELGGHSLLATQIVSRVREALEVELPLHRFFEALTVAEQAMQVEAARQPEVPAILPAPRQGPLPLSFAQERVWFLEQLDPGQVAYNIPRALRVTGDIDAARLAAAYGEIIRRHEVLRTTFPAVSGRPVQRIHPPSPFVLSVFDLRRLPAERRQAAVAMCLAAEGRRPFDLARDRLLRAALLRLADAEHLLVQTEHHLVHDGWAIGVLLRDLLEIYGALAAGRAPALAPLAAQYADFAMWQRSWLTGDVLAQQLAFWRERLEGAPPLLALPTDRPRPPVQTFRGAERIERQSSSWAEPLRDLGRRRGTTLFMVMLAGFAALLERWSGEQDLVVGSVIANRRRPETEGMLGMMINTLALRLDLEGDPTFAELLERVRTVALAAYRHQDLPFEELVRELRPRRSASHPPLVQVLFAFNDAPQPELQVPGLAIEEVAAHNRSAKFDLVLIASPHAEQRPSARARSLSSGINLALEHNLDLFDPATMARLLGQYCRLLTAAATDPSRRISRLPLLSAAETQQLLHEWSAAAAPPRKWRSLLELLAGIAEQRPDGVALVALGEHLTYGELLARSARLAAALRPLGVGPEVRVAVALDRSLEWIVSWLAVLAAGGAFVPLDPAEPLERLAFMLADAGAELLLTRAGNAAWQLAIPRLRRLDPHDALAGAAGDRAREAPSWDRLIAPDDLAYLIYTSGSTGRPKAVMVPHRGLASSTEAMVRSCGLGPGSRVLQLAACTFDASLFEILMGLGAGATVCLADRGAGPELPAMVRDLAITHLVIPPSMMAVVPETALPGLAAIVFVGEALPQRMVSRWGRERTIANVYGPTEVTIWAATARCRPEDAQAPIGAPIAGARLYVLDRSLELAPMGVPGELAIGGLGVARGYLGRPDLTAERFVPDPLSGEPGARLYRSGDLVRHLADGNLLFLGRTDHQTKVHGVRIEPGEIETALADHPQVREAAVIALDVGGQKRLAACVVGADGTVPDAAALRAYLRARLPAPWVPASFHLLAALPLNRHGKVDRHALRAAVAEHQEPVSPYVAPRTEVEAALAGIWREVLAVDRVDARGDFFTLGGHSLLATQVISRLRSDLGVEVPLRCLYDAPRLEQLAELVEQRLLAQIEPDRLDRALREVAALSDEDVDALLADGGPQDCRDE
jgi:amino acid adenylation domain-containing protein